MLKVWTYMFTFQLFKRKKKHLYVCNIFLSLQILFICLQSLGYVFLIKNWYYKAENNLTTNNVTSSAVPVAGEIVKKFLKNI